MRCVFRPMTPYQIRSSRVTKTPFLSHKEGMGRTTQIKAKTASWVLASLLGLMLIACESLPVVTPNLGAINTPEVSGDPCANADWFEVGRIDGLNGIPSGSSMYVGRCLSRGHAPNNELYNAGWQRGLVDYCTPERAFDAGRAGESYAGVCPKNLESAFLKKLKVGEQIAQLEKTNVQLELEVDRKLGELSQYEGKPSVLGDALARQNSLQAEIKKLRDALARNETTIRALEGSAL